jgi:DNA (cytosine-5)-methyltransferase 1
MTYRSLDLFAGAGLVYDGLTEAGFEVVGVDWKPQKRYPGPFLLADALSLDDRFYRMFDAIWASPPCLRDTELHGSARREQRAHGRTETSHADLITPTQKLLDRIGLPFVIENVDGCDRLRRPVTLCGSMFDLGVEDFGRWHRLERHRKFETNWGLAAPLCRHSDDPVVGVYGGHARVRSAKYGGRKTRDPWSRGHQGTMQAAMGLRRYLTCEEISQGIPPAFAFYVGTQLREHLECREAA